MLSARQHSKKYLMVFVAKGRSLVGLVTKKILVVVQENITFVATKTYV